MNRNFALSLDDLQDDTKASVLPSSYLYVRSAERTLAPYDGKRADATNLANLAAEKDYFSFESSIAPDPLA